MSRLNRFSKRLGIDCHKWWPLPLRKRRPLLSAKVVREVKEIMLGIAKDQTWQ